MASMEILDTGTGTIRIATTADLASGGGGSGTGGSASNPTFVSPVVAGAAVTTNNRLPIEILGQPSVARQLAVTAASASATLTTTCRRISIRARGCDMRYVVGTGAQTANAATSHFIGQDERLDIAVPADAVIAAIRETAATVNGSLAITELI